MSNLTKGVMVMNNDKVWVININLLAWLRDVFCIGAVIWQIYGYFVNDNTLNLHLLFWVFILMFAPPYHKYK